MRKVSDVRQMLPEIQHPRRPMRHEQFDSIPDGWRKLDTATVYERNGRLIITANPDDAYPGFEDNDDGHPHNCDAEGCGWEHVVGDGEIRRAVPS